MARRLLAALVILAAACSGTTTLTTMSIEERAALVPALITRLEDVDHVLRGSILSWYNALGLAQLDPVLWQSRLDRACTESFWSDPAIVERLAAQYVEVDMSVSVRATDEPVDMTDAASTLWVMALNNCREKVPVQAVEEGPPGLDR